jgi:thiol:disulfide interchange protein
MRIWLFVVALGAGALLWRHHRSNETPGLQAALASARKAHKPLVLELSMNGCAACRAFEGTILSSPVVKDALRQVEFVRYNISDDESARAVAAQLEVQAFPTVLVVGNDGHVRKRQEGFAGGPGGPAYFADFLRRAAAGDGSAPL